MEWRRHSCLLSPPSLFGVSFLVCLNNNMSWKPRPPLLECYSLAVTIAWG